jgi:hypothetical protein
MLGRNVAIGAEVSEVTKLSKRKTSSHWDPPVFIARLLLPSGFKSCLL